MSVSYYLKDSDGKEFHVGNSAAGWCFALHVFEKENDGPTNFEQWVDKIIENADRIYDEYNEAISATEMICIIADRRFCGNVSNRNMTYLAVNHAFEGPNCLMRSIPQAGFCIGNGNGTWDYIIGDFS